LIGSAKVIVSVDHSFVLAWEDHVEAVGAVAVASLATSQAWFAFIVTVAVTFAQTTGSESILLF